MTGQYEVRESGNFYYPWIVFDTKTSKPESDSCYGDAESAQRVADQRNTGISAEQAYADFFSEMLQWDDEAKASAQRAAEKPAPEEAEFVGGRYSIGDEIVDKDGNVYIASQDSYHVSADEADDLEDGWDVQVAVGWHTPARLKRKVQR